MPEQASLDDDFPTTDGGAVSHPNRPEGYDERQQALQSVGDFDAWPPKGKDHLRATAPQWAPISVDRTRNEAWCRECDSRVTISHVDGTTEFGHGGQDTNCKYEIDRSRDMRANPRYDDA